MQLRFSTRYFLLTVTLFMVEILIGIYVRDWLIRPFGGDILVVVLIYTFCKTFIRIDSYLLATLVLIFAFLIEILQYYHLADALNIRSKILRIIIGTSFSRWDMTAYFAGYIIILLFGRKRKAWPV